MPQPGAGKFPLNMPLHASGQFGNVIGDVGVAPGAQPFDVGNQRRQRCLQAVSQVGGAVAGAAYGLVLGVEQGIDLLDKRGDFLRHPVCLKPPCRAAPNGADALDSAASS